jgi:hypothetical protein
MRLDHPRRIRCSNIASGSLLKYSCKGSLTQLTIGGLVGVTRNKLPERSADGAELVGAAPSSISARPVVNRRWSVVTLSLVVIGTAE